MIYDVIGDIHGHADKLKGLLVKLGYTLTPLNVSDNSLSQPSNVYQPSHYYQPPVGQRAMFIGDLIDRGNQELETLQIVFAMLDAGVADCVMGNHEYNALAYATVDAGFAADATNIDFKLDTDSDVDIVDIVDMNVDIDKVIHAKELPYLRRHNQAHTRQHQAFLAEIPFGSKLHRYWLERFYDLPLWIETQHACFVHACWDVDNMALLKPLLTEDNRLTLEALQATSQKDTKAYDALERVLKGVETPLPEGITFTDKEGTQRRRVRVKWWLDSLNHQPIVDIARASRSDLAQISTAAITPTIDFTIKTNKPIFIGHYWLTGTPKPLSPQVVCSDYSAGGRGYLTAYQLDTDQPLPLSADNFVQYIRH